MMDHTITITIPYADEVSNFDVAKAIMELCKCNEYLDPTAIASMLRTETAARDRVETMRCHACLSYEKK